MEKPRIITDFEPVVLDFETRYTTECSLRRLAPIEYIHHPEFEVHGLGVRTHSGLRRFARGFKDTVALLKSIDWSKSIMIGHNLPFDGLLAHTIAGTVPAMYFDTLGGVGAMLPHLKKKDLDSAAKAFGLGAKVEGVLPAMKGLWAEDLTEEQWENYELYCLDGDCELTYGLFCAIWPMLPPDERKLLSLTGRMACEPKLILNRKTLEEGYNQAQTKREHLIKEAGVPRKILSSNKQFAQWITDHGMEVPRKISKTTEEETDALAKSDLEFCELQLKHPEHEKVWLGRKAVKSTTSIKRLERFLSIHDSTAAHVIAMTLKYCAAHTTRWGGTAKINPQNMKRGSAERKAIEAPPGHVVQVWDSSQIELRFNAMFCGELSIITTLLAGRDVYKEQAAHQFNIDYDQVSKDQRQLGKIDELGLGYGMGWKTLQRQMAIGMLGLDPIYLSNEDAWLSVQKYRALRSRIQAMWRRLQNEILPLMWAGIETELGPVVIVKNAIVLPNGLTLSYPNLRCDEDGQWWYAGNKKIYGGKLLENIIQALARVAVAEQLLRIDEETNILVMSMTHDEIIGIGPESSAEEDGKEAQLIMSTSPTWYPELPLSAEGGWAKNYSK